MSYLPLPIIGFFLFTTLLALFAFAKAVRGSKTAILVSILWMFVQSGVALSGFYLVTNTLPPHFFAAVAPHAVSGDYYGPDGLFELKGYPKTVIIPFRAQDPNDAEHLWSEAEKLTGITFRI